MIEFDNTSIVDVYHNQKMSRVLLVKFRQMEIKGLFNPECSTTITRYIPLKHVAFIDVNKQTKTVDIVFDGLDDKLTLTANNSEGFSKQLLDDMFNDESFIQIKEKY